MKNTGTFFLKRDNLQTGIILGLITPFIVFIIIYLVRFSTYEVGEFMKTFFSNNGLISFFGVWCLVGNIALFTYYINTSRDKTAKGIFAVTVLYGIGVLLLKLFN
ncbi:MAG: hypothetical protein V4676_12285 [Bacteroidota bacterium]